jgi:hypothetical protein
VTWTALAEGHRPARPVAHEAAHEAPGDAAASGMASLLLLVIFLLYADQSAELTRPLMALALIGLIWPRVRAEWFFWVVCSTLLLTRLIVHWHSMDNHQWLMAYFTVALAASLHPRLRGDLATSARLLLGLVFALATFWKLISPDFVSGSFFELELLNDARLRRFLLGVGLQTPIASDYLEALAQIRNPVVDVAAAVVTVPSWVTTVARVITGWTLAIEGSVAVAFLAPRRSPLHRARNALLAVFVVSVYPITPVLGFGAVLLTAGYAQCDEEETLFRRVFLVLFAALPLFGTLF